MSRRAIPVLGYPSKSVAAAALREQGLPDREIAIKLGTSTNAIGNLVRVGRGEATRRLVHQEAAKRGLSPAQLRRALMAAIVRDNLFAVILEDGLSS